MKYIVLAAILATGCASARMSDRESDSLFRQGNYSAAADRLAKGAEKEGDNGRDLLLYLLDWGLALHSAGRYEESNKVFLRADKIAEIKDYTSLSTEAGTLLTSENIKDYKGEDFENCLINTYLAMNYALMGDVENALVEARRVNHKLQLMVTDGQRKYKQDAFARYLSAILYESQGNWNDAYVDYKNTHDLEPQFPGLGRDLWRLAMLEHDQDDMEQWDQEYHLSEADHVEAKRVLQKKPAPMGEIIVIYENGISPIKRPNPQWRSLPKFYPRPNPVSYAQVYVNSQYEGNTAVLHDIEATAIENLDEKYGGMIAKKIGGVVAKEVVANQLERQTKSPLLGFLARVGMYASDQADVRSWNLLPRDLQLLRVPAAPGTYTVSVDPMGVPPLPPKTIQVGPGQKVFVDFRYMP